MVADPADFFDLDPVSLSRLEGLGKKSATKLVKAIEVSLLIDITNVAYILPSLPDVPYLAGEVLAEFVVQSLPAC